MKKKRLDDILIEKKMAESKEKAFVVITEGRVFINGQKAISPAQIVGSDTLIEIREGKKYVGRGALKLEAAFEQFGVDVKNEVCVDIGAATGGFTEVLLKHGAKKVYAIDTARGKLDLKIRGDSRVVVMEQTDVRHLERLPESVSCAVVDVSLVSLREILPIVKQLIKKEGEAVVLLKPQYEIRDQRLLKKGVVRSDAARERVRDQMIEWVEENGWKVAEWIESPVRGSEGNIEYLLFLKSK